LTTGAARPHTDAAEESANMPIALQSIPLEQIPSDRTGGVVAIGNFDGVHRGHAALIATAVADARRQGVPATVLTFEPHPRTFFRPEKPVFPLTPPLAKMKLLSALGVEVVVLAAFDRAFSAQTADQFAADVLATRLRAKAVVVGGNFRYGKDRAGDIHSLRVEGARFGFSVSVIDDVRDETGTVISSSAIRDALAEGHISEANRLLGYRWFVIGEVIAGEKRGRELGFPTANIRLPPPTRLAHGIYAVSVGHGEGTFAGVASFGRRPTFDNGAPLLEVFLFDFSGDLYGQVLAVTFLGWIRPELRFESVPTLVTEMQADVLKARAIAASAGPGSALDRALAALPQSVVPEGSIS